MLAFLKLMAFLWIAATPRPMQGDADEILAELADLRLDKTQIHSIRDVTLRRDVISLSFERGAIAFLEPVRGRVTGAIFVGSGDVLVIPPNDVERRQLNKFTGSPILNEEFNAAVLRFTDDTYEEILRIMEDRAAEDVRADELETLLPWDQNLGDLFLRQNFRILSSYLGSNETPFFFGMLSGKTLGWFDVLYDEVLSEEVFVSASAVGPTPELPDIWASFVKRSEARNPERADRTNQSSIDVLSYDIDTTIEPGRGVVVNAVVNFLPNRNGERALIFDLARTLRVTEVRSEGRPLPFFQHPENSTFAEYGGLNEVVVVLGRPTVIGEDVMLEFSYEGRVLQRRGRSVYFVDERTQWYPNFGFADPASYILAFHYPDTNTLVATGRKEQELDAEGIRHSRWRSEREFFVAGFNYGDFSVASDESGNLAIDVYVNNDIDAIFEELQTNRPVANLEAIRAFLGAVPAGREGTERADVPSEYDRYSRRALAENVLEQVRSTVEVFSDLFGPYPFGRISVSQIPVDFSGGWPSLVYVSTLSLLDAGQREALGFDESNEFLNTDFVRAHEIAHQWFGNKVGMLSYRDQWLIEGLANYAGALYLERRYPGTGRAHDTLDEFKRRLLTPISETRASDETTHDDNGPVTLGRRLTSSQARDGYIETVYSKSAWVLHMLRRLMSESTESGESTDSDSAFFAMLREFLEENDGRAASTRDFKAVAEKYMTDRMDIDGDGTLDWFFDEWVYSTGIPHYEVEYDVQESLDGFVASGRITESELNDFVMPVPVYSRTVSGTEAYLGDVVVDGSGEFFFYMDERPSEIVLDPYDTILRKP